MSELQLIIPSYKRVRNQKTYACLPTKYQARVQFVVRPEEVDAFRTLYPKNTMHCLPKRVSNFGQTKQWILETFRNHRVFVMDDNLTKFRTIQREGDKWVRRGLSEQEFDMLFERINHYLDHYVHGGIMLDRVSPPKGKPHNENSRIMTNVFADFSRWPLDLRFDDHESCICAEDFYINLQLLTRGYPNVVITNIVVDKTMREPGGCNTYRTVANHNRSNEALHRAFPTFTRLRRRSLKQGKWKGCEVCAITCFWKKALKSGLQHKTTPPH